MAEFEIISVDVGQGDCTLVRLPNDEYMLVDVYRCPGHGIDILKLLDDVLPDNGDGRKRLQVLAITHAHDDHITGMADVYDRYHVEWLWLPQHENRKQIAMNFEQYQKVADEHPNDKIYRPQGSRSPLDVDLGDGVTARCFSPPGYIDIDEDLTEEEAKQLAHENCLVLRLSYEGVSATLTGDSNVKCWQRIFGYYKDQPADETGTEVLKTTLLQASHHGSRTFIKENGEDSEAWLDGLETIAPEAVVVSVGEENRHSHPHEDMMDAYRDQVGDDNVYETREHGTIVLEVEAGGQSQIIIDNGRFVEDYGWDDDEDDDEDGGGGDKSAAALRVRRRGASPTRLDNKPAA